MVTIDNVEIVELYDDMELETFEPHFSSPTGIIYYIGRYYYETWTFGKDDVKWIIEYKIGGDMIKTFTHNGEFQSEEELKKFLQGTFKIVESFLTTNNGGN